MSIRERYQNDPAFKALVDQMLHYIELGDTTPTEVREAAMLAQIIFEDRNPRPLLVDTRDPMLTSKWLNRR